MVNGEDAARELEKTADVLDLVHEHLACKNESDAALHMAGGAVRYSPLTVRVFAAAEDARKAAAHYRSVQASS